MLGAGELMRVISSLVQVEWKKKKKEDGVREASSGGMALEAGLRAVILS